MRISTWDESNFRQETTLAAAALSMVPGLGQIYNGEARKGVLYFCAGAANFTFLALICLKGLLVAGAKYIGSNMHVRLNPAVMDCLNNLDMRSPQMLLLCLLLSAFTLFCAREALHKRQRLIRREIYSSQVLDISEAASGSYVFHALMFAAMFLLVLFLFVPPDVKKQITDIEFVPEQEKTVKPVQTPIRSVKNSENAGHVKPQPLRDTPRSQAAPTTKSVSKRAAESEKPATPVKQPKTQPNETKSEAKEAPKQPKPESKTEPEKQVKTEKAESQTHENSATKTPKPPTPNPLNKPMIAPPAPMPATSAISHAQAALPVLQPTKTATTTASASPANPQPLLASSSGLPTQFSAAPAPTASSSTGKNASTPAPAPASSHRSGNPAAGGIVPVVQRDAGQSGGSPGPAPMPTSGSPSKRSQSSDGGPPSPQAVAPSGGHNRIAMATPQVAPRQGTGVTPTSGDNDKPPSVRSKASPDYAAYMEKLQRRIKREWYPTKAPTSNRTVVIFKIFRNGELANLRVLHSSGDARVDAQALTAVEHAAPFLPLPEGADDDIDVQFTFDYNLFTGRGSNVRF